MRISVCRFLEECPGRMRQFTIAVALAGSALLACPAVEPRRHANGVQRGIVQGSRESRAAAAIRRIL